MTEGLRLRQSTVNDFMVCGKRTEYRLANPEFYKGSVMRAAGTGYHAGVARLYLAFQNGELTLEDTPDLIDVCVQEAYAETVREIELATDGFDWRYQVAGARQEEIVYDENQLLDLVERMVRHYISNALYWDPRQYEVLGVEWPFEMPFEQRDGWVRSGTGDLALRDRASNWVILVDHKLTRKKWYPSKAKASASVQAAWYISAAQQLWGTEHVTFVYDVLTTSGDFDRIHADRSPDQIAATMGQAALVAEAIERGGPFIPNTTSFLCHEAYCDWWDHCPYGRTLSS